MTERYEDWTGAQGRFWKQWQEALGLAMPGAADTTAPLDVFLKLLTTTPWWPSRGFAAGGPAVTDFSRLFAQFSADGASAVWADIPALGLNREWESALKRIHKSFVAAQRAEAAVGKTQLGIIAEAARMFQGKLMDSQDGVEITSMKQLYDLWIECAESAYGRTVMTDEYARQFGEFVNTSAEYRREWQALADKALELLHLPNRREMDTIIERQHTLGRELDALRRRLDDAPDIAALRAHVERLTDEINHTVSPRHALAAESRKPAAGRSRRRPPATNRRAPKPKAKTKQTRKSSPVKDGFDIADLGAGTPTLLEH